MSPWKLIHRHASRHVDARSRQLAIVVQPHLDSIQRDDFGPESLVTRSCETVGSNFGTLLHHGGIHSEATISNGASSLWFL